MEICEGVITRERATKTRVEKAVLDLVIVCSQMKEFVRKMLIDENRIYVLTKYASKKGVKKQKISDHNILVCNFSIQVVAKLPTLRKEFFLLKNADDQRKFYNLTSHTDKLSTSININRSFPHNASIFFKNLNSCIQNCFKKVKIKKGGPIPHIGEETIQEKLKKKMRLKLFLKTNQCKLGEARAKAELDELEEYLTETCATKNAEEI